jgi:large subunit ribosomal protein L4
MTEAVIYDFEAEEISRVPLKQEVFAIKSNPAVVHQCVVAYLSNQRQGTHSTLTRAEMSGGGRKPWRQKGTGRARAGSNTSPLWVGGGQAKGPHPVRDYTIPLPKKVRDLALRSALSDKAAQNNIKVIEELKLEQPKTKTMANLIKKLGLEGKKLLLLYEGKNPHLLKSVRNLPRVNLQRASLVNAYTVLDSEVLLMTKRAHQSVEEALTR